MEIVSLMHSIQEVARQRNQDVTFRSAVTVNKIRIQVRADDKEFFKNKTYPILCGPLDIVVLMQPFRSI